MGPRYVVLLGSSHVPTMASMYMTLYIAKVLHNNTFSFTRGPTEYGGLILESVCECCMHMIIMSSK